MIGNQIPAGLIVPPPQIIHEMILQREGELRSLRGLYRVAARANEVKDLVEQYQQQHGILTPGSSGK